MVCMKASTRNLRLTAGILLLVASALAGCTAQPAEPTPTPTVSPTETVPASAIDPLADSEGMLAYESAAGGFRLEYPSEWAVDTSLQTAVAIEYPIALGGILGVRAGFFMVGAPLTEIGVEDLDGLWANFVESLSPTATIDPRQDFTFKDESAYQARFIDPEIQAQGWLITVVSGDQGYVLIVMVQPPVHFETFQPVFDDMLGSVDFFAPVPSEPAQP
jgi:hypothetical protein